MGIDTRRREPGPAREREEARFKLPARESGTCFENRLDDRDSLAAGIAGDQVGKRQCIREALDLRFVDDSFELVRWECRLAAMRMCVR
jgi:hypothetical protein